MAKEQSTGTTGEARGLATRWWTLIAVSVATFMLLLDITVVNTALPSIEQDLGASFTDLQWVIDAYALALAALVLTAGSLADRLGRRRVFAAGLAIFSVASLLCGLAPDPTSLNLARALQGVGGAVMFAVSLALIAQEFAAGRERGAAMGIYGATIGVAVAVGPLVGGALTDSLGWESIFFLNVPIGLAAIAVTYWKLRESRDPNATRIDWGGLVTFSSALLLLVLGLLRGNSEGWGSTLIVSLLAGAVVLLVAFVAIERRVSEPMLPLHLFKRPAFTGVQLAAFAVSSTLFALFLYLTLYLQSYLGLSPLEAGVRYLPITVGSFVFAAVAGSLLSRVPARAMLAAGLVGVGVGLLLMSGIGSGDEWTTLLGGFVAAGAGVGLLNPVIADVALSVVPKEQSGMASGINDTFRQVGVSVGIAAWGALFLSAGSSEVTKLAAGTPAAVGDRPRQLVEAASSGNLDQAVAGLPAASQGRVSAAASEGFLSGLNDILLYGGLVALAGAVVALLLVREREIEREPVEPEPVEAEPVEAEREPIETLDRVPQPVSA
jgi:EmrB/QacA subfamily drug resistance transporter